MGIAPATAGSASAERQPASASVRTVLRHFLYVLIGGPPWGLPPIRGESAGRWGRDRGVSYGRFGPPSTPFCAPRTRICAHSHLDAPVHWWDAGHVAMTATQARPASFLESLEPDDAKAL